MFSSLQAVFVHTSETTCLGYFTDLLIQKAKPVMLVGGAGVGKTVFLNDRLAFLSDLYMITKVPFNYYTTSAALQSKQARESIMFLVSNYFESSLCLNGL